MEIQLEAASGARLSLALCITLHLAFIATS